MVSSIIDSCEIIDLAALKAELHKGRVNRYQPIFENVDAGVVANCRSTMFTDVNFTYCAFRPIRSTGKILSP